MTLFSFRTPGTHNRIRTPKRVGMRAVIEGVAEEKYPQRERDIKRMALVRLLVCAFIIDSLSKKILKVEKILLGSYKVEK